MRRLLLVRHAPTSATRGHAFPTDEPLDDRGRVAAAALGAALQAAWCVARIEDAKAKLTDLTTGIVAMRATVHNQKNELVLDGVHRYLMKL